MRRYLRLYWDGKDWILEVPFPLSKRQLWAVANYAFKFQLDRYRALPHGDRKEELGRALDLLKNCKIKQKLIDHDNDGVFVCFRDDLPWRQ